MAICVANACPNCNCISQIGLLESFRTSLILQSSLNVGIPALIPACYHSSRFFDLVPHTCCHQSSSWVGGLPDFGQEPPGAELYSDPIPVSMNYDIPRSFLLGLL